MEDIMLSLIQIKRLKSLLKSLYDLKQKHEMVACMFDLDGDDIKIFNQFERRYQYKLNELKQKMLQRKVTTYNLICTFDTPYLFLDQWIGDEINFKSALCLNEATLNLLVLLLLGLIKLQFIQSDRYKIYATLQIDENTNMKAKPFTCDLFSYVYCGLDNDIHPYDHAIDLFELFCFNGVREIEPTFTIQDCQKQLVIEDSVIKQNDFLQLWDRWKCFEVDISSHTLKKLGYISVYGDPMVEKVWWKKGCNFVIKNSDYIVTTDEKLCRMLENSII